MSLPWHPGIHSEGRSVWKGQRLACWNSIIFPLLELGERFNMACCPTLSLKSKKASWRRFQEEVSFCRQESQGNWKDRLGAGMGGG